MAFFVPMIFGILVGLYVLEFSLMTSVLLASMFASHTLITYPLVSKLGVTKDLSVNISVGSTLITNILALLVLAVVVGMSTGDIDHNFWFELAASFIVFTLVITFIFPIIGRWFFKRYQDNVSQYIFVLVMVFLGAVLSQLAGIEPIIGAFMAGLALNRLIPHTSPLMNRIDFVGNAIFIPFFLIGVGMLIDFRAFTNSQTLVVAVVMSVVATLSKLFAAWVTQKNFKLSKDQRLLIFGLTNAQAAATLAAVLVGYNIVLGETSQGEPIRLLNDSVLNGTIIMILVTCTIASFATQKGAKNIAIAEHTEEQPANLEERILIPLSNPDTIDALVDLSINIKSKFNINGLRALNIIKNDANQTDTLINGKKILEKAQISAAATDTPVKTILRYDLDLVHGVTNVIKEENITDLVLGLHLKTGVSGSFLGNLTNGILEKSNITTFIYNPQQSIATIKRHLIIVPENAELESGFSFWLSRIWNIALNTGAPLIFYAPKSTIKLIKKIHLKHPIAIEFEVFSNWADFGKLTNELKEDDNLIIVLSRKNLLSYQEGMAEVPNYLEKHFKDMNFLLVYPSQSTFTVDGMVDLTNPSLLHAIEKLDVIGKTIATIFRKK
jgi:Kef-type K+ transport system membrane component KefB